MMETGIYKKNILIGIGLLLTAVLLIVLIQSIGDEEQEESLTKTDSHGFTFFDLGPDSVLTDEIRDKLEDRLGSDAIETQTMIDLTINDSGFMQRFFPEIHKLNQDLNDPPGERVEHDTTKLMYRYISTKKVPFDYVELLFSNNSGLPLLIRIFSNKDISKIIETIESKYGQGRRITWNDNQHQSMYWKRDKDVFVFSVIPDRYGNPEYHITICYTANLEALLAEEKTRMQKQAKERNQAGKIPF